MVRTCYKGFQEIDILCDQLLQFVEAARRSETEGRGSLLAYGFISACASKIGSIAEERRDNLARAQWEQTVDETIWDLEGTERIRLIPEHARWAQNQR